MTILIVDDHAPFRAFVRSMLDDEGFEVVGDASDGESAVTAARELHPDSVLVDVHLGDGIDGFEVARQLAELPEPPLVVLTSSRDRSTYGGRIASAPIQGFLPKDELSADVLAALFGST
jgi:DNA-binding NarL/FixJ family response regulator